MHERLSRVLGKWCDPQSDCSQCLHFVNAEVASQY